MSADSWPVFWQLFGMIFNELLVLGLACGVMIGGVYLMERLHQCVPRRRTIRRMIGAGVRDEAKADERMAEEAAVPA